ncbi:DNA transformation protein [Microvirga flocculans]|uniref:DNA transformation protein n=1 Tax=Microvirga flocculans TaxID=217168 RepID=A0A7W6IHK9_9HYPH|nr:TfoX/Sxy family protein [Microvirga flocculans]MBB4040994.1 DNA transformation protein [Microvirga flocculans]
MDAEAIRDVFRGLGPVLIRRMFGGQGIYHADVMFALEAYGELYLKADDESAAFFRDLGSRPFVYETRDGRRTAMSYWLMPESALDDPDEASELGRMAVAAAHRSKAGQVHKGKGGKAASIRKSRKPVSEPAT